MSLVEEDAIDHAFHRLVRRGIVEDDIGGFSTEFKRGFLLVPAMARWMILPVIGAEPVKAIVDIG